MQTNTMTSGSGDLQALRLINTPHDVCTKDHADGAAQAFSDAMAADDPRWVLAARAQIIFHRNNRIPSIGQYDDLMACAESAGFSPIHGQAIVAIVEEAQFRGGLDRIAMEALMRIPAPSVSSPELSGRARWMTFGVLFAWSLLIAGMMQMV